MNELRNKLYFLYGELINFNSACEQKKEIDFSLGLNMELDFRSKIIERTNDMFSENFIAAIKNIEEGNYSNDKFLNELFDSILNICPYYEIIEKIDTDQVYEISESFEYECEFIEEVRKQLEIGFFIELIDATQLLNSYNYYLNNKPKENRIRIFIKDLIAGIYHLEEELDLNELQKIYTEKKSESFFRDIISFYLKGAGYKTIAESKKGANRIDLKILKSSDVFKVEFKGWWNNDKKDIVNQINQYLTDFDDNGFVFIVNDKQKNIKDEYFELIENDTSHYIKNSLKNELIDNFEFYCTTHYSTDSHEKKLYHFVFNIYKN